MSGAAASSLLANCPSTSPMPTSSDGDCWVSGGVQLNVEWDYLRLLFERGRGWADTWLGANFQRIGRESTFDLDDWFKDPMPRHNGGR